MAAINLILGAWCFYNGYKTGSKLSYAIGAANLYFGMTNI